MSKNKSFTLIEIIIALTISSMVMILTYRIWNWFNLRFSKISKVNNIYVKIFDIVDSLFPFIAKIDQIFDFTEDKLVFSIVQDKFKVNEEEKYYLEIKNKTLILKKNEETIFQKRLPNNIKLPIWQAKVLDIKSHNLFNYDLQENDSLQRKYIVLINFLFTGKDFAVKFPITIRKRSIFFTDPAWNEKR